MITPEQAWAQIVGQTAPLPVIRQELAKSVGCVLAESIRADRDIPPADRSAMDGYAVRFEDIRQPPARLTVLGEIAAGSDAVIGLREGECVRVFTGANLPPGADTVVMQEDTTREAGGNEPGGTTPMPRTPDCEAVTFLKSPEKGANIFRRGENARYGDELVPAGTRLNAGHIGICAATGHGAVAVFRKPDVSTLTTGEELMDARSPVGLHQIRNSNGPMLSASLRSLGFGVALNKSTPDDAGQIRECILSAAQVSDVVLLTGGVSVGKYDFVSEAVRQAGGNILYHGVAIKPGKPQLFAVTPEGKLIFGLPGNPLAVMIGFHEFALPALRRLEGCPTERCRPTVSVCLLDDARGAAGKQTYATGRLEWRENALCASAVRSRGSADLVAGGKADGTIIVPPDVDKLPAGSFAEFRMWGCLS